MNINDVQEIIEVESMIKTGTDELNVVRWQNMSLPVVDPIAMVSFSTHRLTTKSRVMIVNMGGFNFGILVNDVIGVMEIRKDKMEDPGLKEPRYVSALFNDVKVFNPEVFLTKKMVENFNKVYMLKLEHLEEGITVRGEKTDGETRIIENIRMISLNWIIKASKNEQVESTLVSEAAVIHNLASQLKR
jgi:chemotaxis signal transduction protein